jgi:hypothetical protein
MVDVVGEKTPTTASNGCGSFISILMKAARSLNNLNTSSGKSYSFLAHPTAAEAFVLCSAFIVCYLVTYLEHSR